MTTTRFFIRWAWVHLLLAVCLFTPPVWADVTSDGSFTYSIPIKTPPGTQNVHPDLHLFYNSNGANGVMGLGWSLEGLPTITRIDNGSGILYKGNDTYSGPDGRLVDISGNKTSYHSATESWNRYEPIYTGCSAPSGEPCAWILHRKDGKTLYFGFNDDSRIEAVGQDNAVRVWALDRLEDPDGNYYDVQYMEDFSNGDYYPFRVTYSKGHPISVFRTIEFLYESRPDNVTRFDQNARVVMDQRLKWISVSGGGQLVRKYELKYQYNGGTSRLESVQEYGSDGLSTLPPVTFTWMGVEGGFEQPTQWIIPNRWNYDSHRYFKHADASWVYGAFHDMNGDGLPDKVMHHVNGQSAMWVAINNGGGFDEPVQWAASAQWQRSNVNHLQHKNSAVDIYDDLRDMNGDGLPDKLMNHAQGSNGFWVALNTGSGFSDPTKWVNYSEWQNNIEHNMRYGSGSNIYDDLIDMNGDGLQDKVMRNALGQNGFWVALNTGSGFATPTKWHQFLEWGSDVHNWVRYSTSGYIAQDMIDMNGDSLPDKVMWNALGESAFWVALNTGSGFQFPTKWMEYNQWGETWHHYVRNDSGSQPLALRDMNGDGLPDKVMNRANGEDGLWVALNNGTKFEDPIMWIHVNQWQNTYSHYPAYSNGSVHVDLYDINRDNLPDRVMHYAYGKHGFFVALNNGSGFENPVEWIKDNAWNSTNHRHLSVNSGYHTLDDMLDMNGDGLPDKVMHHAFSTSAMWVALNKPGNAVIITVKNGLGGTTHVEYEPSTQISGAIQSNISTCGNGTGDICGSATVTSNQLVTRVRISGERFSNTPQGQVYDRSLRYEYFNGRRAAGFNTDEEYLGFEWQKIINEQTNGVIQIFYRQDKPYHRREMKIAKTDGSGNLISEVLFDYTSSTPYSGVDQVLRSQEIHKSYEANTLVSTRTLDFTHDSYGFQTQKADCVATDCLTTTTLYDHDTLDWHLGFVLETKVVANALILDWSKYNYLGHQLVRHRRLLCPDATVCASDSDGEWKTVAQGHEYDEHGNLLVVLDGNSRLTTYTYDDRYKTYVVSEKNNLGMETTKTYNDAGLVLTETDYNGNVTQTEYDAFGRASRVVTPQGGVKEISYVDYGDPMKQYTETRELEDTHIWWEKNYFDGLGETYRTESKGDSGKTRVIETSKYYEDGVKIVKTSKPYHEGEAIFWKLERYDVADRTTLVTNPDGSSMTHVYTPGQVAISDAAGTTTSTYDGRNRIASKTDASGGQLAYTYDAAARLTQVSLPNTQLYQIAYDSWGRRTRVTDPALGVMTYTYDNAGNVISATHGLANTTTFEYDELDRLIRKVSSNGEEVLYTYDNPAVRNGLGRLTKVTDSSGTTELAYDEVGNIATKAVTATGLSGVYTTQYEYDLRNRLIRTIWQDNTVQEITHTAAGNLYQVKLDGIVYGTLNDYTATGKVGSYQTNTGVSGYEVTTTYDYNNSDRLRSMIVSQANGTVLRDHFYSHDTHGNIVTLIDNRVNTIVDSVDTSETQFFDYDALNRLTQADGVYGLKTYNYDALGNMMAMGGLENRTFAFNDNQQILADTTNGFDISYDDRGNMISKTQGGSTWTYNYDDFNRLTSVLKDAAPLVDLTYNYQNQRMKKVYHHPDSKTITTYYLDNYELRQDSTESTHTITKHVEAEEFGKIATVTELNTGAVAALVTGTQYHNYASLFSEDTMAGLTQKTAAYAFGSLLMARDSLRNAWNGNASSPTPPMFQYVWIGLLITALVMLVARLLFNLWKSARSATASRHPAWVRMGAASLSLVFFVVSCAGGGGGGGGGGGSSDSAPVVASGPLTLNGFAPQYDPESEVPFYGQLARVLGSTTSGPPVGTWFYHPNHIRSATLITDGQGNEATRILFLPYGEIDDDHSTGNNTVTHKFTGQEWDEETGLMYFNARFYDPSLGRFLTPDTIIPGQGLRSQGFNRYSYVEGNPIAYHDPTGHLSVLSKVLALAIQKIKDRIFKRPGGHCIAFGGWCVPKPRPRPPACSPFARCADPSSRPTQPNNDVPVAPEPAPPLVTSANPDEEPNSRDLAESQQDDKPSKLSEEELKNERQQQKQFQLQLRNVLRELFREVRADSENFRLAELKAPTADSVQWVADSIELHQNAVHTGNGARAYLNTDALTRGTRTSLPDDVFTLPVGL